MDGKMLARLGAVVFVGVAITATAIEMTRQPEQPEVRIPRPDHDGQSAPLRPLLRHCRDMGEAAARDPACLKAWAENRDRFLRQGSDDDIGADPRPASGAPTTLFPTAPGEDPIRKDTMPADAPVEPPASPDEGVR